MRDRVGGRHPLDVLAQSWMRATSRTVTRDQVPWLLGPAAGSDVVGHGWVERVAEERGGRTSTGPDHGLPQGWLPVLVAGGDVRADHSLTLLDIPGLRLHYRMRRAP